MHRVVVAVFCAADELLLARRQPTLDWLPGVWALPGGHVGSTEAPVDALVREVSEELGVGLPPTLSSRPDFEFSEASGVVGAMVVSGWLINSWDGQVRNAAPEEHMELHWFPVQVALDMLHVSPEGVSVLRRRLAEPSRECG